MTSIHQQNNSVYVYIHLFNKTKRTDSVYTLCQERRLTINKILNLTVNVLYPDHN